MIAVVYFPVIWLVATVGDFSFVVEFLSSNYSLLICFAMVLVTLVVSLIELRLGNRVNSQFEGFYYRSTPNLKGRTHLEALGIARSYRNPSFNGKLDLDYYVNFTILKWLRDGICSLENDVLHVPDVNRVVDKDENKVLDYLQLRDLVNEFDRWSMEELYAQTVMTSGDSLDVDLKGIPKLIEVLCARVADKHSRYYKYATVTENPVEKFFEKPGYDTSEDIKVIKKFRKEHEYVELISQPSLKKRFPLTLICGLTLSTVVSLALLYILSDGSLISAIPCICLFVCGAFLTFLTHFVSRERHEVYSDDDLELTKQVLGLENWIKDFTNLSNKGYDSSIVWDDFVLWASLFGLISEANAIGKIQNVVIANSIAFETNQINLKDKRVWQ